MNLTLHLIKTDLRRCRWALLCWLAALGYLFYQASVPRHAGDLRDYLQVASLLTLLIMSVGLIADIVQADHPTREDSHWRTLPISAARLVTAKLLLVGALFVVLPLILIGINNLISTLKILSYGSEYVTFLLIFSSLSLSLVAVAACTKNVVHCLLVWLGLYFGTVTLAEFLSRYAPELSRQAMAQVSMEKMLICLTLSVVMALAVILNQYLRRHLVTSIILMLTCAVSTATIGAFYGYYYTYQG